MRAYFRYIRYKTRCVWGAFSHYLPFMHYNLINLDLSSREKREVIFRATIWRTTSISIIPCDWYEFHHNCYAGLPGAAPQHLLSFITSSFRSPFILIADMPLSNWLQWWGISLFFYSVHGVPLFKLPISPSSMGKSSRQAFWLLMPRNQILH